MTTKAPAAPAKPAREKTRARRTAERYAIALLAAALIPALVLHSLLLSALGVLAVLVFAGFRVRKAHRQRRAGGKSAMRQRAKFQGHATLAEIRRNLSHDQGVPIGTVRSTR